MQDKGKVTANIDKGDEAERSLRYEGNTRNERQNHLSAALHHHPGHCASGRPDQRSRRAFDRAHRSAKALRLRRINRIRTIRGSLAIEGNTLSEAQITAILDGKRVIAPPREIQEVHNAIAAYDRFEQWRPEVEAELLEAHRILMAGLH